MLAKCIWLQHLSRSTKYTFFIDMFVCEINSVLINVIKYLCLLHNLKITVQIGRLICTEFLWLKMAAPENRWLCLAKHL